MATTSSLAPTRAFAYPQQQLPPPQHNGPLQLQNYPPMYQPQYAVRKETPTVKWTKVHAQAAKMCYHPHARHGHRALPYKNLMIVISGGNEGLFRDVHVFNTSTNEWSQPLLKGDIPPGRAAFGAVIDGHRILMFGGMEESCVFTNTLYELNVQKWEWTQLNPKPRTHPEMPCPRIGHSFTLIKDRVYMFGGLANLSPDNIYEDACPSYLSQLHVLLIRQNMQHGVWELPITFGTPPTPRESHTAVAYVSKDSRHNKLVIYGGMFGQRLGDLYTLDVDTMMWSQIKYDTRSYYPLGRSLHSSSIVGDKMYVFGGWVHLTQRDLQDPHSKYNVTDLWRCDNTLSCLNLKTMTWEKVSYIGDEEGGVALPSPRAGHSAVVINNKIYIWSGRDGYAKHNYGHQQQKQACYYDFWKLEVSKPPAPEKVKLIKAYPYSITVAWDPVPGADGYILQSMRFDMPTSATFDDMRVAEKKEAPRTAPPVQHLPVQQQIPSGQQYMRFGPPQPNAEAPYRYVVGPQGVRQGFNPQPGMSESVQRVSYSYSTQLPQHNLANFHRISRDSVQPGIQFASPQVPITQAQYVSQVPPAQNIRYSNLPAHSSGIAPTFNWQQAGSHSSNPISRTDVNEVLKVLQQRAQFQARPSGSPSVAPPASAGLFRQINPNMSQGRPMHPDSATMPPPRAPVPNPAQYIQPQIQGNAPQQFQRPQANNAQPTQGARHANIVRILNSSLGSKSQHQQQNPQSQPLMYLTGSHGIPGSSAPQPPVDQRASDKGAQGQVNPQDKPVQWSNSEQGSVGIQPSAVYTVQQNPQAAPHQSQPSVMMQRPGQYTVRVTPAPNQPGPRGMQYVPCRMPDGNTIMIPASYLSSGQASVRHIRLSSPAANQIAVKKDEGRKMVAVEGMLQLSGQHNVNVQQQMINQAQGEDPRNSPRNTVMSPGRSQTIEGNGVRITVTEVNNGGTQEQSKQQNDCGNANPPDNGATGESANTNEGKASSGTSLG